IQVSRQSIGEGKGVSTSTLRFPTYTSLTPGWYAWSSVLCTSASQTESGMMLSSFPQKCLLHHSLLHRGRFDIAPQLRQWCQVQLTSHNRSDQAPSKA